MSCPFSPVPPQFLPLTDDPAPVNQVMDLPTKPSLEVHLYSLNVFGDSAFDESVLEVFRLWGLFVLVLFILFVFDEFVERDVQADCEGRVGL